MFIVLLMLLSILIAAGIPLTAYYKISGRSPLYTLLSMFKIEERTGKLGEHLGAVYGIRVYTVQQQTVAKTKYVTIEQYDKYYRKSSCRRKPGEKVTPLQAKKYEAYKLYNPDYYIPPSCWCDMCIHINNGDKHIQVADGVEMRTVLVGGFGRPWNSPKMTMGKHYGSSERKPCEDYEEKYAACRCGINMFSWLGFRKSYRFTRESALYMSMRNEVYALTKGTGHVAIHPDGYRVEHAEVIHIFDPYSHMLMRTVSGFEDIPVTRSLKKFEAIVKEHSKTKLIKIPDNEG